MFRANLKICCVHLAALKPARVVLNAQRHAQLRFCKVPMYGVQALRRTAMSEEVFTIRYVMLLCRLHQKYMHNNVHTHTV
jgi:hypothetical protein